ncbi:MAG: hypothetical protein KA715_11170 [Xanthomonadaceae bacterium]|nr:hypothetical protein [Xanthomonadaceae bacterium]
MARAKISKTYFLSLMIAMSTIVSCVPAWTGPSSSETKKLLKEFKRAQSSQLKALNHQQDLDLKELKTTLKTEKGEIKTHEQKARKAFFDEHPKGAERREYIKAYIDRMKKMEADHARALDDRKKAQRDAKEALIKEQKDKLTQFEDVMKNGTLPDDSLWPPKGH